MKLKSRFCNWLNNNIPSLCSLRSLRQKKQEGYYSTAIFRITADRIASRQITPCRAAFPRACPRSTASRTKGLSPSDSSARAWGLSPWTLSRHVEVIPSAFTKIIKQGTGRIPKGLSPPDTSPFDSSPSEPCAAVGIGRSGTVVTVSARSVGGELTYNFLLTFHTLPCGRP